MVLGELGKIVVCIIPLETIVHWSEGFEGVCTDWHAQSMQGRSASGATALEPMAPGLGGKRVMHIKVK